jgi:hypothetical protein
LNPHILQRLLAQLHILPHPDQAPLRNSDYGIRRFSRMDRSVPRIFEMIVHLSNGYSVWSEIDKVLEWRVHREEGRLVLANKYTHTLGSLEHHRTLFSTLKLLRTIFELNEVLLRHQEDCPDHFVVRTLSSLTVLNRVEVSTALAQKEKHNHFLLALLANLQSFQPLLNDSARSLLLETEQEEVDESRNRAVLSYLRNHQHCLDFEQASNFVKPSRDRHYENEENVSTLALDNILLYLRTCPDCCLEFALEGCPQLNNQEGRQLRFDMVAKLTETLLDYLTHPDYLSLQPKLLRFACDLKYNLGRNQLNGGLGDSLLLVFMRLPQQAWLPRTRLLLLQFMAQEVKLQRVKFEKHIEWTVAEAVGKF